MTAPAVSIALCMPNIFPLYLLLLDSASRASLAVPLMPFPNLSENLANRTTGHVPAMAKKGLHNVDRPYPMYMKSFLLPNLSESQPETNLRIAAVLSAMPSIRPMTGALAPITLLRKRGSIENIISELMSMKKLTMPIKTMFLVIPSFMFLMKDISNDYFVPCFYVFLFYKACIHLKNIFCPARGNIDLAVLNSARLETLLYVDNSA